MGIAAYNRGTAALSSHIDSESRPVEFEILERLNSLPKYEDAGKPFGPVQFASGNGGVWITCPVTGFCFWYPTMPEAIRRWRVEIVAYNCGTWEAIPQRSEAVIDREWGIV